MRTMKDATVVSVQYIWSVDTNNDTLIYKYGTYSHVKMLLVKPYNVYAQEIYT